MLKMKLKLMRPRRKRLRRMKLKRRRQLKRIESTNERKAVGSWELHM